MREATRAQRGFAQQEDDRCFPILEAAGVDLIRTDDFDRPAFVAATAQVSEAIAGGVDDDIMRFFRQ